MSLYKQTDIDIFTKNIDKVLDDVTAKTQLIMEPTIDERKKIQRIIKEFVKQKKRKIYGGYAHHLFLVEKDKKAAIYSDDELLMADIEFYSPEPIVDTIELCNLLNDNKLPDVKGREANHKETYTIFVNGEGPYCDISYMPWNVFNSVPFKEIDGLIVTHPLFASIDYLRIFSDPMTSWEIKLGKRFERFCALQKYYPFPIANKALVFNKYPEPEIVNMLVAKIQQTIAEKQTCMLFGFYAYNHFLKESGLAGTSYFKYINVPYIEAVSSNYKEDAMQIIEMLRKLEDKNIMHEEHYPFFQFLDYCVYIY